MNNQRKDKKFQEREVKRMKRLTVFLVGFFLIVGLILPASTFAGVIVESGNGSRTLYGSGSSKLDLSGIWGQNGWRNWGQNFGKLPGFFGELRDLQQEYKDAKQALLDEKDAAIVAVKDAFAQQKENLQGQVDEIGQEEQQAIDGIEAGYADQETELQGQIDTLKDAKSEALTALRDQFISDLLTAIKEVRLGDIVDIIKDYIADKKEVKEGFDEQIEGVEAALAELEGEKEAAIQEIKDAFAEEKQGIEDQIAELDDQEEQAIAEIEQEYEDNLAALQDEYKTKITDLWHEKFGENSDPSDWVFNYFFAEQKSPTGLLPNDSSGRYDLMYQGQNKNEVLQNREPGTYLNKNDYMAMQSGNAGESNSEGVTLEDILQASDRNEVIRLWNEFMSPTNPNHNENLRAWNNFMSPTNPNHNENLRAWNNAWLRIPSSASSGDSQDQSGTSLNKKDLLQNREPQDLPNKKDLLQNREPGTYLNKKDLLQNREPGTYLNKKDLLQNREPGTYLNKNDYMGIPCVPQMGGTSYKNSLLER